MSFPKNFIVGFSLCFALSSLHANSPGTAAEPPDADVLVIFESALAPKEATQEGVKKGFLTVEESALALDEAIQEAVKKGVLTVNEAIQKGLLTVLTQEEWDMVISCGSGGVAWALSLVAEGLPIGSLAGFIASFEEGDAINPVHFVVLGIIGGIGHTTLTMISDIVVTGIDFLTGEGVDDYEENSQEYYHRPMQWTITSYDRFTYQLTGDIYEKFFGSDETPCGEYLGGGNLQ